MTISKKLRNFTFTLNIKKSLNKDEKEMIKQLFINNVENNLAIKNFSIMVVKENIFETDFLIENISTLNSLLSLIHYESKIILPHIFIEKEEYILDKIVDIRKKNNIFIKLDYLPLPHIYLNGPPNILSDIRIQIFIFLKNIYKKHEVKLNSYSKVDYLEPNERSYRYIDYSFSILKFYYIFFYRNRYIEKILARNKSYLNTIDIGNTSATIRILAKKMKYINRTLFKLKKLLHTIYKIVTQNSILLKKSLIFYEKNQQIIIFEKKIAKRYIKQRKEDNITLELMFDYSFEEFICGKKNGKINKIVRETDIHLSLLRHTEFTIILNGTHKNIYKALLMIEDEYPAELNFSINEKLHKRVIGVGGRNIQEMMKRYGVYIKFMNSQDAQLNSYGGNVIIKTPKKNQQNLFAMKKEIFSTLNINLKQNDDWKQINYTVSSLFDYPRQKGKVYFDYMKTNRANKIFYFKFDIFSNFSFPDVEKFGFKKIEFNDGYFFYYIKAKKFFKLRENELPAILNIYDWGNKKNLKYFKGTKSFFLK